VRGQTRDVLSEPQHALTHQISRRTDVSLSYPSISATTEAQSVSTGARLILIGEFEAGPLDFEAAAGLLCPLAAVLGFAAGFGFEAVFGAGLESLDEVERGERRGFLTSSPPRSGDSARLFVPFCSGSLAAPFLAVAGDMIPLVAARCFGRPIVAFVFEVPF
jgi:hypothetical protein